MAIYLDANVLWPWVRMTEPERLAVSIVAHQLGQEVFVPGIAMLEAEEELRRRLKEELDKLDSAQAGLERITGAPVDVYPEPMPDIDEQLVLWRERLGEFATVLPLADEDAQLALRREIEGRRPARPREKGKHGAGGRDAAVWLTIRRHHRERDEPGHFLSGDKKAFADAKEDLDPSLAREIGEEGGQGLAYYKNADQLIQRLGTLSPERELDLEQLQRLAVNAISSGLEHSPLPPRALWLRHDPDLRFSTKVTRADLLEVLSQRRYVRGDQAVLAINSRWDLIVTSWWQRRDTDEPGNWMGLENNEIKAELQLLVEEEAGELRAAELIGAELASPTSLSMMEDGSIVSIGGEKP